MSQKKLFDVLKGLYISVAYNEQEAESYADNALKVMGTDSKLECDINIRLFKGGAFKIKNYYLENDNLST